MNKIINIGRRIRCAITGGAFYCICLFFNITFHILQSTEYISGSNLGEILNKMLLILTFFLSVRFLLIPKKSSYNYVWIVCFILLFISYRAGDNRTLLDTFVLATSAFGADFVKIAITAKWTWVSISILVIARPLAEIILCIQDINWFLRSSYFYLGFQQQNAAGLVFFSIGLCLFITCCFHVKWENSGGLLLLLFLCWFLTKSRASTVCLGLLLAVLLILKLSDGKWLQKSLQHRKVVFLMSTFGIILSLFSLWMAVCYDDTSVFMQTLSKLVNHRFEISGRYYQEYGITLWGQEIPVGFNDFVQYLDSGYIYTLLNSGAVVAIIILILYTWALYKALSEKNVTIVIGIMVILLILMMERQPLTSHMSWILSYGFATTCSENAKELNC